MNKEKKTSLAVHNLLMVLAYVIFPIIVVGFGVYSYYIDVSYKKAIIDLGKDSTVVNTSQK